MERAIEREERAMRKRYVASTRHTIQVDFHPYMRTLRASASARRGVKRSPLPVAARAPAASRGLMPGVAVVTGAGRGFGREIAQQLAARAYTVLATDIDGEAAAATAHAVGGFSMQLDVRDPEAHRRAARAALERGPLEVWVNNAGVLRTSKAWEPPGRRGAPPGRDQPARGDLGLARGRRRHAGARRPEHARDQPRLDVGAGAGARPGASTRRPSTRCSASRSSLQGELLAAGVPITMHVVCPDGADTEMTRERAHEPDSAIIWSSPRMLSAEEVADAAVGLLDSKRLVLALPRWRGVAARAATIAGRPALHTSEFLRKQGERKRARG